MESNNMPKLTPAKSDAFVLIDEMYPIKPQISVKGAKLIMVFQRNQ